MHAPSSTFHPKHYKSDFSLFPTLIRWVQKLHGYFRKEWHLMCLECSLCKALCVAWCWHSSQVVMGEACHVHESGYCKVSVCAPLPAHRTDCSAQDWTLSNSFERHARAHCDHTPPTQHRARMQPPYTHAQIYIHTHTLFGYACLQNSRVIPRLIITHFIYVGNIITARTCEAISPALLLICIKMKPHQQTCKVTKRHLQ